MAETFENDLLNHLKQFHTNPYLFIGSGISRRYYNLPTWENLLEQFYQLSKLDTDFNYYLSKNNNDLMQLASELANEFHEVWWKNSSFKKNREANSRIARHSKQYPFKYEISQLLKQLSVKNKEYNTEIDAFSKSVIEGVITTNWDDFIQSTFPEFKTYIGQQEILFSQSFTVGEIYKIHGCSSIPQSIIVTNEDYEDFNSKNAYLAAKLLTIFVEHPVIFLGYSISDPNILEIISSIVKCVDKDNQHKLKDRLIFVEWNPDQSSPVLKDSTLMLKDNTVLPIKLIQLNEYTPLYTSLSQLERKIPVKVLRKLKETVCEFVRTSKPTNKIYVGDLSSISDDSKIEYVVGVGAAQFAEQQALNIQGYKGIKLIDIIEDILLDNKHFNNATLLSEVMPDIAKGNTFVPLCKYFKEADYFDKGKLSSEGAAYVKSTKITYRQNMPNCFLPPGTYKKRAKEANAKYGTYKEFLKAYKNDIEHALLYTPYIDRAKLDLDLLCNFLKQVYVDDKHTKQTYFRKAVCLYDYYKYCAQPLNTPSTPVKK